MARESGICPIREELHSQGFDELIRQITIESSERGLLLMRVRDEIKMTIAAQQTLQESSVTFGTKKQIMAEQGKNELKQRLQELKTKKELLSQRVEDLNNKSRLNDNKQRDRQKMDTEKRNNELDFWKKTNE